MEYDFDEEIVDLLKIAPKDNLYDKLIWVLSKVLEYQEDKIDFLYDTFTMIDENSIKQCHKELFLGK